MQLATIEFMKRYADVETIMFLDWESYFKSKGSVGNKSYSLKSLTYAEYILGDRFAVTGLGVADDLDEPEYFEPIDDQIEQVMDEIKLRRENGERIALCAFNTGFDGAICNWRFGVHFDFYYDAQAMHILLRNDRPHNLGSCGKDEFPNDPSMWKTDELANVDGLYFRYFSDEDREGMERYGKQDVNLMRALACRYVERIIERGLEDELALMHITLRAAIEPQFVVDERPLLDRITIEEKSKIETVYDAADFLKEKFNFDDIKNIDFSSNVKFPQLLEQIGVETPMKTHKKTKLQVPALGKNDPEYVRMRIDNQQFEVVFLARDAVKSTNALTRAKKFIEVSRLFTERSKHVKNKECNMPFFLKYHGADQTGRWSGGQKLNQQNLEADRANDGTKGHHRRSLMAPNGYKVAVSDLSNIELRVNMWFCGQNDILEQMRDPAYDYYCDVATPIFGFPVIKSEHKNERQMGKAAGLGLGFAMGWPGFQQYLASGPLGMDAMFKDDEFCRNVKTSYDRKHPMVKEMWSFIEKVVIKTICQGGEVRFGPDQQFIARKDEIQLPSGRILRYPKAEYKGQETEYGFRMTTVFDSGLRTKSGAIVPKYMWFGLILENIVQATARDVLGWQKVRIYDLLESTGNGELIGSVHDETLSNLKDETVDATFGAIQSIMSSSPIWALGIPLDNEGGYAQEYSK